MEFCGVHWNHACGIIFEWHCVFFSSKYFVKVLMGLRSFTWAPHALYTSMNSTDWWPNWTFMFDYLKKYVYPQIRILLSSYTPFSNHGCSKNCHRIVIFTTGFPESRIPSQLWVYLGMNALQRSPYLYCHYRMTNYENPVFITKMVSSWGFRTDELLSFEM